MTDQAPTFERPKTLAEKLPDIFTYHSPKGDQPKQYQAIREGALDLANIIVNNTPPSADQTAAIRLATRSGDDGQRLNCAGRFGLTL